MNCRIKTIFFLKSLFFEFSKYDNARKNFYTYTDAKFQADLLKSGRVLLFSNSKFITFPLLPEIPVVSLFSNFVPFGPFKTV